MNEKNVVSRRDLIASAVAAGFAATPSVSADTSPVDFQESEDVIFVTTDRRLHSAEQLKQLTHSIWTRLQSAGSKLFPVVLDSGMKIQFPSPYTFHEKLGDYEFSIGCRTKDELIEVVKELRNK